MPDSNPGPLSMYSICKLNIMIFVMDFRQNKVYKFVNGSKIITLKKDDQI